MTTLLDACWEVMNDPEITARYPKGIAAVEVLEEIRKKRGPDAFPLCTWLDVYDEMKKLYGAPRRG